MAVNPDKVETTSANVRSRALLEGKYVFGGGSICLNTAFWWYSGRFEKWHLHRLIKSDIPIKIACFVFDSRRCATIVLVMIISTAC